MPEREFVVFVALLMALTALSIDVMLPAMPAIADAYALADANDRQAIVTAFMLGFAVGHPLFGPLADRFGRVGPLLVTLVCVFLMSVAAAWAPDYGWMLVARFVQGVAGAGTRVIAMAIVRDRYGGRNMARIMSVAMSIFIIVPIVAPGIGGLLVAYGHWRWAFLVVGLVSLLMLVWTRGRLAETLRPEDRLPLRASAIARSMSDVATDRFTLAHGTALGLMMGAMFTYLGSAQQIFGELYGLGDLFPLAFSAMACGLVVASLINSRIVERIGMRPISRVAAAAFTAVAGVHALVATFATPPLVVFSLLLLVDLFLFGLMMPNLNALAMEPHGHRAGIASAYLGFYSTALGAVLGGLVGRAYDGTVLPMMLGYVCLGGLTFVCIRIGDDGRVTTPSRA